MIQQERLIEEFTELVGVDSETKEERNIADLLLKKLTGLGLEAYETIPHRRPATARET